MNKFRLEDRQTYLRKDMVDYYAYVVLKKLRQ